MDEMDDFDEDEQIFIDQVPFIAAKDFLGRYGASFSLAQDEKGTPVLSAVS